MPKHQKKKAFTLTELLVVVVIIGVLAAVILPKFNKVLETRKTTEAEEVMAAVRMEQEYRCAMDKPYIGDISKLSQIPQAATKNFAYQLEETGILARSTSKAYDLKMPSYADGRVCCTGTDCAKLNKDYPKCDDLKNLPDYRVATECTAVAVATPDPTPCAGEQILRQDCDGCGWKTRTVTGCVEGQWQYSAWTGSCKTAKTETYDCATKEPGTTGTKTRTQVCDEERGEWYYPDEWEGECTNSPQKACEDWFESQEDFDSYCAQYNKTTVSFQMASSKAECCISCQEAEGSIRAKWDVEERACVYEPGSFEPQLDTSITQYRIYYDRMDPEYTYSFGDSSDHRQFTQYGASIDSMLRQDNPGNEIDNLQQSFCSLSFLENKYDIMECPSNMNSFCDNCDTGAATCDKKCYNEDVSWGSHMLLGGVKALAFPIPSGDGTVDAYYIKQGSGVNPMGWTVRNGDGSIREGSGFDCDYSGCTTTTTIPEYDIDCSHVGVSGPWEQLGQTTVKCTRVHCGSTGMVNPANGFVYWQGGAVVSSPHIDARTNVYTCVKSE